MITYELALKLKNLGFEIKGNREGKMIDKNGSPPFPFPIPAKLAIELQYVYIPTLFELIQACGEDGIFLWKYKNEWYADDIDAKYHCFSNDYIDDKFNPEKGSSPEEAVANLCLKLKNQK